MQRGVAIRSLGYKQVSLYVCCTHEDKKALGLDRNSKEKVIWNHFSMCQTTPFILYLYKIWCLFKRHVYFLKIKSHPIFNLYVIEETLVKLVS